MIIFLHSFDDLASQKQLQSYLKVAEAYSNVFGLKFFYSDVTPILFEGNLNSLDPLDPLYLSIDKYDFINVEK